jgi:hypothetical protein
MIRSGRPRTANTAVRATPKRGEQSENVYENKRRSQKVKKPLTRLGTLATLSLAGEGPLMTFDSSAQKLGEQSQNVHENKGQVQNVLLERGPGQDFESFLEAVGVEGFLALAVVGWVTRLKPAGSGPCLPIRPGATRNRPSSVGSLF